MNNPHDPIVNIKIPVSQLQIMLDFTGNGPFNTVAPIINSVKFQAETQLREAQERAAAEAQAAEEAALQEKADAAAREAAAQAGADPQGATE